MYQDNPRPNPEEEEAFLTEKHCFTDLLDGMKTPCPCGISHNAWLLSSGSMETGLHAVDLRGTLHAEMASGTKNQDL